MKKAKLWIALVLLVMVITLVLQNRAPVSTNFLFFSFTMPRATLLALSLLVGIVIGILMSLALAARRNRSATETGHGGSGGSGGSGHDARTLPAADYGEPGRNETPRDVTGHRETGRDVTGSPHGRE